MKIILMVIVILIAGCASPAINTTQFSDPLPKRICVIPAPKVLHEFLPSLVSALKKKIPDVEVLSKNASRSQCTYTATYVGHWQWDLATYLSKAKITIYKNGIPYSDVAYEASNNLNLSKYGSADQRINRLVGELF